MNSGRTVAERFNFGKNDGFLAIFANGDRPGMLNYLQNAKEVREGCEIIRPGMLNYLQNAKEVRES
jgi:hypothetical protein